METSSRVRVSSTYRPLISLCSVSTTARFCAQETQPVPHVRLRCVANATILCMCRNCPHFALEVAYMTLRFPSPPVSTRTALRGGYGLLLHLYTTYACGRGVEPGRRRRASDEPNWRARPPPERQRLVALFSRDRGRHPTAFTRQRAVACGSADPAGPTRSALGPPPSS